ncbi:MAG: enoyl-CoA hydratase/isomerase family protein [Syntrophaceae bacterium]|nr:enoyl-CoA hydratase/isomerase family protein [Syntrophaceae bacterium]
MDFQNIRFERDGAVATIRLNRPKNFNAIDFGLGNDLARALEMCHDDDGIRVVAITGEGKAFCSGGDLKLFREKMDPHPQDIVRQLIKVFNVIIMGIRQMPKPVVAVVNGPVGGGGVQPGSGLRHPGRGPLGHIPPGLHEHQSRPRRCMDPCGAHADRVRKSHGARPPRSRSLGAGGDGMGPGEPGGR